MLRAKLTCGLRCRREWDSSTFHLPPSTFALRATADKSRYALRRMSEHPKTQKKMNKNKYPRDVG